MSEKKVSNIEDLTLSLAEQYGKLVRREITTEEAEAASKMAASLIMACRVQMDYNKQCEVQLPVKFLEPHTNELPTAAEQMRQIENGKKLAEKAEATS